MPASTAPADFIHVIEDALDPAWCAAVVARLGASRDLQPGRIGSGVFPDMKDSLDLTLLGKPEWDDVASALIKSIR